MHGDEPEDPADGGGERQQLREGGGGDRALRVGVRHLEGYPRAGADPGVREPLGLREHGGVERGGGVWGV